MFLFYEEGVTEAVGRAIESVDALGLQVLLEPDLVAEEVEAVGPSAR